MGIPHINIRWGDNGSDENECVCGYRLAYGLIVSAHGTPQPSGDPPTFGLSMGCAMTITLKPGRNAQHGGEGWVLLSFDAAFAAKKAGAAPSVRQVSECPVRCRENVHYSRLLVQCMISYAYHTVSYVRTVAAGCYIRTYSTYGML